MPELTEEELKEYENALARGDVRRPEEIKQDATETSGLYDAILSGLSNDETARLRWVASKRFPEAEGKGIDPLAYYYIDEDGDERTYLPIEWSEANQKWIGYRSAPDGESNPQYEWNPSTSAWDATGG
mgnify:CR=1 FL=1